jgi:small ligand-binding sensory domain FIST
MKWASALSHLPDTGDALTEAADAVERQLEGREPHLLLAFLSAHHATGAGLLAERATRRFPGALLAGCTGLGVIGGAHEAEGVPALSLTAASLPGVALTVRHLDQTDLPAADDAAAWRRLVDPPPIGPPKLLVFADPFTFDAGALLAGLDRAFPGCTQIGGLASGGRRPGDHRLVLGRQVHRSGAICLGLSGAVEVEAVVAQGCRAIGQPMIVTRCRDGLVQALDRGRPLDVLMALHRSLDARDQELLRHSLFAGLDMREARVEYDPGELLVRNIVGVDEESGALAVAAEVRPLQVLQFVLRDAHTAEQDLRRLLQRQRGAASRPAGALLFSCTGRGAGLFGHADHDTALFEEVLGPAPLGGFFCNGEIGPVGGSTFLHGYTSAFALFRAP